MAAYRIVTQYPDVEVLGSGKTRDVQVIGVTTNDHGVYFEFRVPRTQATTARIRDDANGLTIIYELLFDIPGVSAVQWTQEPTPTGLLADHVLVYVTSTSGESESVIDVPYSQFNQNWIAPKVKKLRAALDATEET